MKRTKMCVISPVAKYRHPENIRSLNEMAKYVDIELFEANNYSEVSRARQFAASKAYRDMEYDTNLVLWWDADMALASIEDFMNHVMLTHNSQLCISGRYPMRQLQKIAAIADTDGEKKEVGPWTLLPVYSGMGALMLPVEAFRSQLQESPFCNFKDHEGSWLICAPRIEPNEESGHVMISEDFDYCRSLKKYGGVWYAHTTETGRYINYAHMIEKPMADLSCEAKEKPHE